MKKTVANSRTCKSHLQEEWQQIAVLFFLQSPFEHSRCFGQHTKGADGAADLLEVLRNSPLLEKLNFEYCDQVPSTAWQRVPSGAWPALRDAPGIPEEELSRIVSGGGAACDGSFWGGRLVLASDHHQILLGG